MADCAAQLNSLTTFVDLVRFRARRDRDKVAFTFLLDGENKESSLSFAELERNAQAIAAVLQTHGAKIGDRALLLYPPSLEYITALIGCFYAGVVAVPAYPPELGRSMSRLQAVIEDAKASVALTTSEIQARVLDKLPEFPGMKSVCWLVTDGLDQQQTDTWKAVDLTADMLALLQYTSGSTSTPRGVMLTHGNLLNNQRMIQVAFEHSEESTFVGWLPMFHDMGLMGNVLQPLYIGARSVLMSPLTFVKQPIRWLRAISKYRAQTSGAPNFAYDLCVSKTSPEQRASLDLSSWSVAFCGAEPIRHQTFENFSAAFSPFGFRRESFYPCYGLAEATLFVSGGTKAQLPLVRRFRTSALEQGRVAALSDRDQEEEGRDLVGCGRTWLDQQIVIVDPDSGELCPPDRIGEIWVAGPNVGRGYWERPSETDLTFNAALADRREWPFLRTGDLGFLQDGELFVTGRLKDLIIIRGRNHFPQDIEHTVQASHPALRANCGAAFSIDRDNEERLVVVQELTREGLQADPAEVSTAIREAIAAEHDLQADTIVLVSAGSVPKTSSGKIQRRACRALHLERKLKVVSPESPVQRGTDQHPRQAVPPSTQPIRTTAATLLQSALTALQPAQRDALILSFVRERIAGLFQLAPGQIDVEKSPTSWGLDSLKAVELQHAIEVDLGINFPMANLLTAASVSELASQLLTRLLGNSTPTPPTVEPPPRQTTSRSLSYGQEGLWYLQQLSPDSLAYNIAYAVRIRSPVNAARLRRTFELLVDRHPSLRTTFPNRTGKPVADIHAHQEVCFHCQDAATWDEIRMRDYLVEQSHLPFDLERGPLLRIHLLTRSERDHVLMICVHHIVVDFWSILVLMQELGEFYGADDPAMALTQLPAPRAYAEFLQWQAAMLTSADGREHEAYWRQQLAGDLPVLQLPIDHPRPAIQTYRGASHGFQVEPGVASALHRFARDEQTTLYVVLLAAFQTLLHRYTGDLDVLVGSPVAGRNRAAFASIVGYFANMIVIRGNLAGEPTFQEFLSRLRATVLEGLRHQDYPFALVASRLQSLRDPSRSPVFQAAFVLEKPHVREDLAQFVLGENGAQASLGTLQIESLALQQRIAQFDLTLMMVEAGGALHGSIQYNSDLFDAATIQRMTGHFRMLLEGLLADPQRKISDLPLLTEPERAQLLVQGNATCRTAPQEATIGELFEQQAARTPEAIAVTYESEQLTYRELNARANQLARYLRQRGVGPEVLVGLCLHRSLEMVVSLLGILKAGGAYVPLDPAYPQQRLDFLLADSAAATVITHSGIAQDLPRGIADWICIDADWPRIAQQSPQNLPPQATAENLAYVIYTSGSTGTPKGTAVCHGNVTRLMDTTQGWFAFGAQDVWTLFHSCAFDFSVWELWGALLYGGRLVVVSFDVSRSPELLYPLLEREGVTVLNQTPSAFGPLMAEDRRHAEARLPLRYVIFGGEALDVAGLKSWLERHGSTPSLINMYGITETTVHVTYRELTAEDARRGGGGSVIGRRLEDWELYLLDRGLQPVPQGVAGEMYVGGAGLSRGYLRRPALTAERFIPHPFSPDVPGARLYRSGDQARYRAAEDLEYLGRLDEQVKIRGFRIELGEIESVLREHPAVRAAAVLAREDEPGDKRLVAYIVPTEETAALVTQLRSYLQEKLPDYMVPAACVPLESFPRTPSGKIDRRAFPPPEQTRRDLADDYLAPRTPDEQKLAAIWSEVLGIQPIGVHDNFFALGGDSLLAVQIAARAREAGIELMPQQLFKRPTIEQLVAVTDAPPARARSLPRLNWPSQDWGVQQFGQHAAVEKVLPLSPMQEGMHFHTRYEPNSGVYFEQYGCYIRGDLCLSAFRRAWQVVTDRHAVFRTCFPWEGLDQPIQLVFEHVEVAYTELDWQELSPREQQERLSEFLNADRQRGFDLAQAPLMRLAVIKLGEDAYQFIWTVHHLVLDGWSTSRVLDEVHILYEAYCRNGVANLARPTEYSDYLAWLEAQDLPAAERAWRDELRGFKLPTSIAWKPSQAGKSPTAATYGDCTARMSAETTSALRSFAKQHCLTLNTVVQGVWALLLCRYAGEDDVVFGATVSGRRAELAGIESIIGLLINTIPVRAKITKDQPLVEWLDELQTRFSEMLPYDYCSLAQVQQWSEVSRTEPLFESVVVFENFPRQVTSPADSHGRTFDLRAGQHLGARTNYPLTLLVEPLESLTLRMVYDGRFFDAPAIQRMLEHFEQMLEDVVQDPARPMGQLPLLKKQEIVIASTFTADPVQESLSFWMRYFDAPTNIQIAPYGQVFQQLLDPHSLLNQPVRGTKALLIRLEDWQRASNGQDQALANSAASFDMVTQNARDLVSAVRTLSARDSTSCVVCLCPSSPARADRSWLEFTREIEQRLQRELEDVAGVRVISAADIRTYYPVDDYYDPHGDELAHAPYTPEFFAALGTTIARHNLATHSAPYKVVTLDCDQTLWKGVCGEDGADGIQVDPPRQVLQDFMIAQRGAGRLLCLLSKNSEADVMDVFDHCQQMRLRRDHFVAWKINWRAKSLNIQQLADELRLGLDSFIHLDDDPVECAEVRTRFSEVLTLQLPKESAKIPDFLRHIWAFDSASVTNEDQQRSTFYQQNLPRERLRSESLTFAQFLEELQLRVDIREMSPQQFDRVAQLTQRTNQFNVSTRRRTVRDLECCRQESSLECLTVDVGDRFGDYGLVGVILFECKSDSLLIDTFLLSCRALGRGVEHQMLARIGGIAKERGLARIIVPFVRTDKNQPALDFLESIGGERTLTAQGADCFAYPTGLAAALTYRPASDESASVSRRAADDRPRVRTSVANRAWRSARLRQVSDELSDPQKILQAIDVQQRVAARSAAEQPFIAPHTETQQSLASLWMRLLHIDRVGVHDNFFELGGHSLLATQLISRARDLFSVDLPLRSAFDAPTVAGLAECIDSLRRSNANVSRSRVARSDRSHDLALSFGQERLWFLHQMAPESTAYNVPAVVRLRGRLRVDVLRQAFAELVRRHETLRTTFGLREGKPRQVIGAATPIALRWVDLRQLSETSPIELAQRLRSLEAARPFDLEHGPLWRVTVLHLNRDDHVLLVTLHHAVSDGWSMGVLIGELSTLYEAFYRGQPSPLADLPLQYADFAAWQREQFESGAVEPQLAYWKEALKNAPQALDLPTDRARPPVQSFAGASQSFVVSPRVVKGLRAVARQESATLFMTLLAAFQTLLQRYTGQSDLLVGTPVAGRNRSDTEGLIGFLVNTLVLRANLRGDPTFCDLLAQVREVALAAYAHQDLPFEKLVEELAVERDLSRSPLFQVMFVLQNTLPETVKLVDLTLQPWPVAETTSQFDLTLSLREAEDGLVGSLTYNTDLFESRTVLRMVGHFQTLLEALIADPRRRLSALPLLTTAERVQLQTDWNGTRVDYPDHACLQDLFESQVTRTPDRVAVAFEEQQVTYRQLNASANQLAHYLRNRGVGPEVMVGICLERSVEMVVAIWGILKAGGAYVPLDPEYPVDRLSFMLAETRVPLIITQERLATKLPAQAAVVCIDTQGPSLLQPWPAHNRARPSIPDSLAYVIYTSGSTGKPKGAMNSHRGICNRLRWMQDTFQLHESDHVLQKTPFSFDVSVWEFLWPLMTGARLVVARPGGHRDAEYLASVVTEAEITTLHFVPSMLRSFLEQEHVGPCPSVSRVICSGEALAHELQEHCLRRLSGSLHNLYGPTEAAVDVTHWPCQRDDPRRVVPIGRPIANTQIHVLDDHQQPVPAGIPGELYIGGVQVARGYVQRPALTAERFLPSSIANAGGDRVYRTGDLARYCDDGAIEYLGRQDHQVKIRGMRIELEEIEAVLLGCPTVKECVVAACSRSSAENFLAAYVVPAKGCQVAVSDMRERLRATLPDFMVPAAFVLLDALPLSANGKVDRQALPVPELDAPHSEADGVYVAPRNPQEELLANIWSEVLGIKRLGVHDNFFFVGGHSLLAAQVMSRVRSAFGVSLPLRTLFESPTVDGLAGHLNRSVRGTDRTPEPPLRRVDREAPLPLSFAQSRLWFLDQLQPESAAYNLAAATRLAGDLNVNALQQVLGEIARRHEALRTTISTLGGEAVQVIRVAERCPLRVVDLQHVPEAERLQHCRRLAADEGERPFHLSQGPLMRATLLRLDHRDHVLLLTLHHVVSDGWSTGVFGDELTRLHDCFRCGQPSPLPDLPIQYADYAFWQRERFTTGVLESQLAYWKDQLQDAPPILELPTDRPRPAVQRFRGASQTFAIQASVTEKLKVLSQQEGATLFMTLLAAFQMLLHKYSGQRDFLVGTPVAGRSRTELEKLIGLFVNTLVIRANLRTNPSFRELLAQVREVALEAYAHQELPFEKLVDEVKVDRDLSRTPLIQVMFALQNAPQQEVRLAQLALSPLAPTRETSQLDLTLTLGETENGLIGSFTYNTDLFDPASIRRMQGHFETILDAILADRHQPLSSLTMLSEAERGKLLVDWNDTYTANPHSRCIHKLFEEQVERSPDAIAVAFQEQQLTYRKLNAWANQLARHLRKLGVAAEVPVAICMERSVAMVVSQLAVLKAGAGYLPMDPTYPPERLAFMLKDSAAPIVLTEQKVLAKLPDCGADVVCVDTDWQAITEYEDENLINDESLDNLAYVIYTSGSTGLPKGVQIQHSGLINLVSWHTRVYGVTSADRATQLAALSFDASVWELWPYLVAGARVHLADEEPRGSPTQLLEWLAAEAVTICFLPTPLTEAILEERCPTHLALRVILTGGDKLSRRPPDGLPFSLVNHYGPTENTVVTTCAPVMAGAHSDLSPPIGRPIDNNEVYLLDPQLQLVPVGVPGEIHIGGVQLARAYVNRPELTAERFVPHAFSAKAGARLYKTGDRARYLPNGDLEFLGRTDHQLKIRGFRIEPGEIEAVLGRHSGILESVVVIQEDKPGELVASAKTGKRLVAYLVSEGEVATSISELRSYLKEKLPDYMVPSTFVWLDALPRLPNGKVDRSRLPSSEQARFARDGVYVAPGSPRERMLADIWSQVLGVERVGVHDNFFQLGGDSILSIQVVARAHQSGLRLTTKHVFQHQTVAELAMVVQTPQATAPDQCPVNVPLPLTPIQKWFFDQEFTDSHHFNQGVLLQVREELHPSHLQSILERTISHHDALHLRFSREESGWRQVYRGPSGKQWFSQVDLCGLAAAEQREVLEAAAASAQASLNLVDGPLLRVVLFNLAPHSPRRLLIVIHHLVVDVLSWRILLQDVQTAYDQSRSGQPIGLPAKTTAFTHWAQRLTEYAASDSWRQELQYWVARSVKNSSRLPRDNPAGDNSVASERTISVSLSVEDTQALLTEVPDVYHTQINDVLLTALVKAFKECTGSPSLLVDLEGHGREELFADVDVSRTVGWFTTMIPVLLEIPPTAQLGEELKSVKEQLRAVPSRGLGYGVLRYLHGSTELVESLRSLPQAEVSFNYVGQFDQALPENSPFGWALESSGPNRSLRQSRQHLLDVFGIIRENRLQVSITYSRGAHRRATIEQLSTRFIEALRSLIAHCQSRQAGGYAPADFPLAALDQSALDRLVESQPQIEDIYPLSPMQQGLLFHALYDPKSQLYFEQYSCTVQGHLDFSAFQRAWQQVVDRHSALRASFCWEGLSKPVQVIRRRVPLTCQRQDWRDLSADEQETQLGIFLEADRERGFDLSRAPLIRLALLQLADTQYQFIFSHHHLLFDGWSLPLILKEVFASFEAFQRGEDLALPDIRPYRDYIAWLQEQDRTAAEAFWRKTLQGFVATTPLRGSWESNNVHGSAGQNDQQQIELSAHATGRLKSLARQEHLTLNTLVQGTWALLLSRFSGQPDVVFGVTVSGRPADLAGVEHIVGLFINTLPVRVRMSGEQSLLNWLKELQAQQVEAHNYGYSSLADVQRWSEAARGVPLFDSILIFENYPSTDPFWQQQGTLKIPRVHHRFQMAHPLSIIIVPGSELLIRMVYDRRRFDANTITTMLKHFEALIQQLPDCLEAAPSDVALAESPMESLAVDFADQGHDHLDQFNFEST